MKSSYLHLAASLVISILALVGYGFAHSALSSKSAQVAELQAKIDENITATNRMASARAFFSDVSDDENMVRGYFVPETGVVDFIDSLEELGRALDTSVNVQSVSTEVVQKQQSLSLTLSIRGTFDAVMRTLGAIEFAPYDISLKSLTVNQDEKNVWQADLKMSVGFIASKAIANSL
jgi:CHASE3 domain sensor protein